MTAIPSILHQTTGEFQHFYADRSHRQPCSDDGWFSNEWWVVVGKAVKYLHPLFKEEAIGFKAEDTKVIAKSILELFERIVAAEGRYYFDEPDFEPDELPANAEIE